MYVNMYIYIYKYVYKYTESTRMCKMSRSTVLVDEIVDP